VKNRISVLCFWVVIIIAYTSAADIPQFIKYQGRLTDSAGTPLDGSYNFTFTLYDDATGGSSLWTESQVVSVSDGLFHTSFGANGGNLLTQSVFNSAEVWLGIAVDTNSEFTPRERISAVPYAYQAGIAQTALSTGGSSWFLAGNLADLEAGGGQIAGYPVTEYEYGFAYGPAIHRARCDIVAGGLVFCNVEPFLLGSSAGPPLSLSYGGIFFMKNTVLPDDDAATSAEWYYGPWVVNSDQNGHITVIAPGFSEWQVYARKL